MDLNRTSPSAASPGLSRAPSRGLDASLEALDRGLQGPQAVLPPLPAANRPLTVSVTLQDASSQAIYGRTLEYTSLATAVSSMRTLARQRMAPEKIWPELAEGQYFITKLSLDHALSGKHLEWANSPSATEISHAPSRPRVALPPGLGSPRRSLSPEDRATLEECAAMLLKADGFWFQDEHPEMDFGDWDEEKANEAGQEAMLKAAAIIQDRNVLNPEDWQPTYRDLSVAIRRWME